jgi:hypothetical protein
MKHVWERLKVRIKFSGKILRKQTTLGTQELLRTVLKYVLKTGWQSVDGLMCLSVEPSDELM